MLIMKSAFCLSYIHTAFPTENLSILNLALTEKLPIIGPALSENLSILNLVLTENQGQIKAEAWQAI